MVKTCASCGAEVAEIKDLGDGMVLMQFSSAAWRARLGTDDTEDDGGGNCTTCGAKLPEKKEA